MLDLSLHVYNQGDSTSGFNVPHRFRIARANGQSQAEVEEDFLQIWRADRKKVLKALVEQISTVIERDSFFVFAAAPSRVTHFVNDIRAAVTQVFPNALDKSNCFSRIGDFQALTTNRLLTNEELRARFSIDENCFNTPVLEGNFSILLLDDVYAIGNTFNAIRLLISDLGYTNRTITAAILRTQ